MLSINRKNLSTKLMLWIKYRISHYAILSNHLFHTGIKLLLQLSPGDVCVCMCAIKPKCNDYNLRNFLPSFLLNKQKWSNKIGIQLQWTRLQPVIHMLRKRLTYYDLCGCCSHQTIEPRMLLLHLDNSFLHRRIEEIQLNSLRCDIKWKGI